MITVHRTGAALLVLALLWSVDPATPDARAQERPRARDAGVVIGVFEPGPNNAITDVGRVRVGHATAREGDSIRTGVTAIVPAEGDLYRRPVPAWIHVGNGYGKLVGETQVREFGEIETPVLLTCTLCVWAAAEALADHFLHRPGEPRHTINPVIGETNDSRVNDMWADPIGLEHVEAALASASGGPVEEGSVGAGHGTSAFGWKGGIGTASRMLPDELGGYTVGVLVQSNFGGILRINGVPVGRKLGRYPYRDVLEDEEDGPGGREAAGDAAPSATESDSRNGSRARRSGPNPVTDYARSDLFPTDGGSIMMVLATDAPLTARNLERLSERAMMGLARTGSYAANSSGDYVIAFSTAESVRRPRSDPEPWPQEALLNPQMSPLFAAAAEATEEAVINSLFKATPVSGRGRTLDALPLEQTLEILRSHDALGWDDVPPHGPR